MSSNNSEDDVHRSDDGGAEALGYRRDSLVGAGSCLDRCSDLTVLLSVTEDNTDNTSGIMLHRFSGLVAAPLHIVMSPYLFLLRTALIRWVEN